MAADLAILWDYAEAPGLGDTPELDPDHTLALDLAGAGPQVFGYLPAPHTEPGALVPAFAADLYDRIHVNPLAIGLGNVISQQVRTAVVWNAWRRSRQQVSVDLENADGISASGASLGALAYGPLQERSYLVTVTPDGPAVIQARIVFTFD